MIIFIGYFNDLVLIYLMRGCRMERKDGVEEISCDRCF